MGTGRRYVYEAAGRTSDMGSDGIDEFGGRSREGQAAGMYGTGFNLCGLGVTCSP